MKFTVYGSSGFIGGELTKYLKSQGYSVETPKRGELPTNNEYLGHVIYAIGLTGDFRSHPFNTVEANVSELVRRIKDSKYDSWLYLSSTRLYGKSGNNTKENDLVSVVPSADGIYDISKLLGESICLALDLPTVRVARLSNVYGQGQSQHTFLGSIFRDIAVGDDILIYESEGSSKDYISIDSVVDLLTKIAISGQHRVYNVASGIPVQHGQLADVLRNISDVTNVTFKKNGIKREFPLIDTSRIVSEFGFKAGSVLRDLDKIVTTNR